MFNNIYYNDNNNNNNNKTKVKRPFFKLAIIIRSHR